jgi:hypothetical protein
MLSNTFRWDYLLKFYHVGEVEETAQETSPLRDRAVPVEARVVNTD